MEPDAEVLSFQGSVSRSKMSSGGGGGDWAGEAGVPKSRSAVFGENTPGLELGAGI